MSQPPFDGLTTVDDIGNVQRNFSHHISMPNSTQVQTYGKQPMARSLVTLPAELLHQIASSLPLRDAACLALTSRFLNLVIGPATRRALKHPNARIDRLSFLQRIADHPSLDDRWLCDICCILHKRVQAHARIVTHEPGGTEGQVHSYPLDYCLSERAVRAAIARVVTGYPAGICPRSLARTGIAKRNGVRFWFAYRVHVDSRAGEPSLTLTLDLHRPSRRDRRFVAFGLDDVENPAMCLHCMPRLPRDWLKSLCDFSVVRTFGADASERDESGLANLPWLLPKRNGVHWTERVLWPRHGYSHECRCCGCAWAAEWTVPGDPLRRVRFSQAVGSGRPHDANGVNPESGLERFQM